MAPTHEGWVTPGPPGRELRLWPRVHIVRLDPRQEAVMGRTDYEDCDRRRCSSGHVPRVAWAEPEFTGSGPSRSALTKEHHRAPHPAHPAHPALPALSALPPLSAHPPHRRDRGHRAAARVDRHCTGSTGPWCCGLFPDIAVLPHSCGLHPQAGRHPVRHLRQPHRQQRPRAGLDQPALTQGRPPFARFRRG